MQTVGLWLEQVGLPQHAEAFLTAALVLERIRSGELAYVGGMADDTGSRPPGVQLKRRRLHHETRVGLGREVECDLVRGAWTGRGDRAAEARLDRPVQVAAEDPFHLRVLANDTL